MYNNTQDIQRTKSVQTITFSGDYPELIDISLTTFALDRTYAVMVCVYYIQYIQDVCYGSSIRLTKFYKLFGPVVY